MIILLKLFFDLISTSYFSFSFTQFTLFQISLIFFTHTLSRRGQYLLYIWMCFMKLSLCPLYLQELKFCLENMYFLRQLFYLKSINKSLDLWYWIQAKYLQFSTPFKYLAYPSAQDIQQFISNSSHLERYLHVYIFALQSIEFFQIFSIVISKMLVVIRWFVICVFSLNQQLIQLGLVKFT